jgi:hypothetical protein
VEWWRNPTNLNRIRMEGALREFCSVRPSE